MTPPGRYAYFRGADFFGHMSKQCWSQATTFADIVSLPPESVHPTAARQCKPPTDKEIGFSLRIHGLVVVAGGASHHTAT